MHVHGSWSEGAGSWEAQYAQAAGAAIDVLYLSDHDDRSQAYNYLPSLTGAVLQRSQTGSLSQQDGTANNGALHLLAESANGSPASVALTIQPKPNAFNRLRTSIAGHTLRHTFAASSVSGSAVYEITVLLSYHPATQGRPAGAYQLVYRFGSLAAGRHLEGGGLIGVVTAPLPSTGTTVTLSPVTDVAALWPTMLALDNCFYGLAFTVRSPAHGSVANIGVSGVNIVRTQSDPSHIIANQATVVSTYASRFPTVTGRPVTEVGRFPWHMNPIGVPQIYSDYTTWPTPEPNAFFAQLAQKVHTGGGVITWNHPFGYNTGPLLSPAARISKRRTLYAQMRSVQQFGVDVLEVGYTLRGQVDAATHLALWDTFSRSGIFLTGNGTSDDHSGQFWKTMSNGFATGVWASSKSDAAIVAALAAGRAYLTHIGRWPGGQLDMLVDGVVPMGAVSVSSATGRSIAVFASGLASGSRVQLVAGPVDYSDANDPGTGVLATLAPSSFSGGVATVTVSTTAGRFYRAQVLNSAGAIIGSGNPVWLLRSAPPGGIPPARSG